MPTGRPPPWRTAAHREPPSSLRRGPTSTSAPPSTRVCPGGRRSSRSTTPSRPTTGVGSMLVPPALVVEADVAAHHGDGEGTTGVGHAVDGVGQLAHHARVLGVPEVQAVHEGERSSADAGQVGGRLGHHHGGARPGVDGAPPVVAVGGEGQRPARRLPGERVLQLEHGGLVTGPGDGVEEELVVVLAPDPRGVEGRGQQVGSAVARRFGSARRELPRCGRWCQRPVVAGGVLVQRSGGDVGQHLAVEAVEDAQAPAVPVDGADDTGAHLPTPADGEHLVEGLGLDDGQHPFLALARHHLERLHARLPLGHGVEVHVHPHTATAGRLAGGTGQPGGAEVLDAHHQPGVEERQARLDQALLLEGVAHLDARALGLLLGTLAEPGRGKDAGPPDAVTTGGVAEQHGHVPHPRRPPQHQAVDGQDAQAQHVDQRVVGVGLVAHHLTADGGHPDGVAVARHPADDPLEHPAAPGVLEGTDPEGVHQCDRACPHGEDVTQDAPDAGGRPLVGLDGRRVVVALDPDGHGDAVAHVDHARVLTGAHQHVGRLGGEPSQVGAGRLVGAVLRPHDPVHGELQWVRRPLEDLLDGLRLVVGETKCAVQRFLHGGER